MKDGEWTECDKQALAAVASLVKDDWDDAYGQLDEAQEKYGAEELCISLAALAAGLLGLYCATTGNDSAQIASLVLLKQAREEVSG